MARYKFLLTYLLTSRTHLSLICQTLSDVTAHGYSSIWSTNFGFPPSTPAACKQPAWDQSQIEADKLHELADQLTHLHKFCHLAYSQPSMLKFGRHIIFSEEGAQHGDPKGSLLFCLGSLAIKPMLQQLTTPHSIAYITLGGSVSAVSTMFNNLQRTAHLMD
jgi:hypothetical protein